MLFLILGCALFCVVFYYLFIRPISYWKKRGVKQGSPSWVFGDYLNIILRRENLFEAVKRFYNEHPEERYSGIYQMLLPYLLIKDLELIKQVTVKDFEHFADHRSIVPENVDPLWAKNLFSLKGQKWREMRPVLSPSFTSSKMKAMFVLINECVNTFIDYFKNQKEDIIEVEMKDLFTRYANDVIASVAFGVDVNSLKDRNNEFYLMGNEATNFSGFWKAMKFFGYTLVPKLYEIFNIPLFSREVTNFFVDLVEETIRIREEKGIVRPDMITLLLEARQGDQKHEENTSVETGFATVEELNVQIAPEFQKNNITNVDIAAQALIFFFAGFDSVSTIMASMAYELGVNADIQERLRDEINDTFCSCDGKLTYENLMKMKYMDMVVSETLRKWPNVIALDRVCTKSYTVEPLNPGEKPFEIQKGEFLWIPVVAIHHDPKYYPQPEKFDPERFNDENKHKITPYTYMPFGLGPRNCIGSRFALMECKLLFFKLLLNFELVPIKKTNIPLKISRKSLDLRAEGGNWLGFKRINK